MTTDLSTSVFNAITVTNISHSFTYKWWGAGVVICLERGAVLHMAQLMPLPLTISCSSKIQIGSTFLVPAYPGSPGKSAVKRVCVTYIVLPTRWRQKSTGVDMEQNYATVTLRICASWPNHSADVTKLPCLVASASVGLLHVAVTNRYAVIIVPY